MNEELSQLLAGELTPDAAAALRRRIDTEPEVARAWAAMKDLPDALAGLPTPPPPPDLDARVLATLTAVATDERLPAERAPAPVTAPTAPGWWGAAPWAVAAALGVALLLPRAPESLTLADGSVTVDGRVRLAAGDVVVETDGRVRVDVEPAARASAPADGRAARSGAAAEAVLVTVAVIDGDAVVRGADGAPTAVHAGESRRFGEPSRPAPASRAGEGAIVADDRVAELERRLAAVELENAIMRGQLQNRLGSPLGFPADLPPIYRPDGFAAAARQVVDRVPGTELVQTDCEEYPCIAFYRAAGSDGSWAERLDAVLADQYGDQSSVFVSAMRTEDDGVGETIAAVAVTPEGDDATRREVRTRLDTRIEPFLEDLRGGEAER